MTTHLSSNLSTQIRCPYCFNVFRVSEQTIQLNKGLLRCDKCFQVVDSQKYKLNTEQPAYESDIDYVELAKPKPDNLANNITINHELRETQITPSAMMNEQDKLSTQLNSTQTATLVSDELTDFFTQIPEPSSKPNKEKITSTFQAQQLNALNQTINKTIITDDVFDSNTVLLSELKKQESQSKILNEQLDHITQSNYQRVTSLQQSKKNTVSIKSIPSFDEMLAKKDKIFQKKIRKTHPSVFKARALKYTLSSLLLILLLVALALQYIYLNKNKYYSKKYTHHLVVTICKLAGCDAPAIQPNKMTISDVTINTNGAHHNQAVFNFSLTNQANIKQPYPTIVFNIKELNNDTKKFSVQPQSYNNTLTPFESSQQTQFISITLPIRYDQIEDYEIKPQYWF